MFAIFSEWVLKLIGWRVVGGVPNEVKKYVIAVMPHTSNWDFPLGLLVRSVLRRKVVYLAKSSLFKFPFGYLFRAMGGYPVERSKSTNFVQAVVNVFNRKEEFAVCISPEGTRKKVDKLKTGFYYIAKSANIPLVLCKFDYGTKTVTYDKPYYTTDNIEKDFEYIINFFKDAKGKIQENNYIQN